MNIKRSLLLFLLSFTLAVPAFSLDEESILMNYLWEKTSRLTPPQRPRIALVLGGGGARGLAHIGVLKILEQEKVPVDIVVGTSVGALIGSLYAAGVGIDKIEKMGENVGWGDISNLSDTALVQLLLTGHLLSTEKMEKYIDETIGYKRFDELKIPFACIATDLMTGERVIFRDGAVGPAVRASSTIPGLFDPVEYRHRYLVDGGLYDNIPVDVAKLLDADFVIAVSVSADFSKNKISNVYMVLTQSIYIQGKILDAERLKQADFIIQPKVSDITVVDLGRSADCIEAGTLAAHQAMPALKKMLVERTSAQYLFQ